MTFSESTPTDLISSNFTINTQTIDRLSVQYNRNIEQVPTFLAIPGPISLRNRQTINEITYQESTLKE